MAYVEEEFLEEPIEVPPKSLLYTIPDDYLHPRTYKANTGIEVAMEGVICVVQEEFPHMAPGTYIHPSTSEAVAREVTDMKGVTCTMQEDFPISVPPPLNAIQECDPTPPSLFSPEQLELIFNIKSYMADQLHLDTLINDRIDMLFEREGSPGEALPGTVMQPGREPTQSRAGPVHC